MLLRHFLKLELEGLKKELKVSLKSSGSGQGENGKAFKEIPLWKMFHSHFPTHNVSDSRVPFLIYNLMPAKWNFPSLLIDKGQEEKSYGF